jgi:hypothetical protein
LAGRLGDFEEGLRGNGGGTEHEQGYRPEALVRFHGKEIMVEKFVLSVRFSTL